MGPAIGAAVGLAGLVWVATRHRRGAVRDALLAALAVSPVVNDTPSDVLGGSRGGGICGLPLGTRGLATAG
jgi:hypothetical protein